MTDTGKSAEYLKITEAADKLGVSYRTVYRWIKSGDLPASKVGGLYLIHVNDFQEHLNRRRTTSVKETMRSDPPTLKCASCLRLLKSDSQIAGLCVADGCEELICKLCWQEGERFCAQHTPGRDEKWAQAVQNLQTGEYTILVKGSTARLQEVNFLNRIEDRVTRVDTFTHPITQEALTISDWDEHIERGDDRAELMQLLGKVVLDAETTARVPLNAYLRWQIPPYKRQKGAPVEVLAQVLSRMAVMLGDGFDTQALNEDDLTAELLKISQEAEDNKVTRIVVLASPTGWDESARNVIRADSLGKAFSHRSVLFYLFDLQSGELIYNPHDERLSGYAELFAPLLPSEELEEVITAIKKELLIHDSLTSKQAEETLKFPSTILRNGFEALAEENGFALVELPENEIAIMRT